MTRMFKQSFLKLFERLYDLYLDLFISTSLSYSVVLSCSLIWNIVPYDLILLDTVFISIHLVIWLCFLILEKKTVVDILSSQQCILLISPKMYALGMSSMWAA